MSHVVLLAACLFSQTGTVENQEPGPEINWPANTDHEHYYNSKLRISRLLATPEWKPTQENPPLSARKALAIGTEMMRKLEPYGKEAKFTSPTLKLRESDGRWFWVVYFSPNDWRRFQSTFPVVVLMDGTAIEPQRVSNSSPKLGDQ